MEALLITTFDKFRFLTLNNINPLALFQMSLINYVPILTNFHMLQIKNYRC